MRLVRFWMFPASAFRVTLEGPTTFPPAAGVGVDGRIYLSSRSVRNCWTTPSDCGIEIVADSLSLAAPQR